MPFPNTWTVPHFQISHNYFWHDSGLHSGDETATYNWTPSRKYSVIFLRTIVRIKIKISDTIFELWLRLFRSATTWHSRTLWRRQRQSPRVYVPWWPDRVVFFSKCLTLPRLSVDTTSDPKVHSPFPRENENKWENSYISLKIHRILMFTIFCVHSVTSALSFALKGQMNLLFLYSLGCRLPQNSGRAFYCFVQNYSFIAVCVKAWGTKLFHLCMLCMRAREIANGENIYAEYRIKCWGWHLNITTTQYGEEWRMLHVEGLHNLHLVPFWLLNREERYITHM
jgi:hypothetical protein